MPQLLNNLKCDSLDWGVIAIYTCINSCATEASYCREFAHKQDVVQIEVDNEEEDKKLNLK